MPEDGNPLVTLICPPGAESAPISHGPTAYWAYPEVPGSGNGRFLVRVPKYVSFHLLRVGGFTLLEAG
jgi:hypothetical protein